MIISLIVALDEEGGIGKDQHLLCHLPADLAYFKAQTMGKPMIMGRHTFDAIGQVLPGRRSIVLSHQALSIPGVDVVHSLADALLFCAPVPEVMVIGGGTIYAQFLPLAQRIYTTRIHHRFAADVFFPEFDPSDWSYRVLHIVEKNEKNKYSMTMGIYERHN